MANATTGPINNKKATDKLALAVRKFDTTDYEVETRNLGFAEMKLIEWEWAEIDQAITGNLGPLLTNLDPSLFQNIVIAILAIFIPFAIVFLTDVLNSKKDRSEFEKMVLSEEVLGAKSVFWIAVLGVATLAFFHGTDVPVWSKLIAILIAASLVIALGSAFGRALRFSEGYKSDFEVRFLKRLNFNRILRYRNKQKSERMELAWRSFWSEQYDYREGEYTPIFVRHIDDALNARKYNLAVRLARSYQSNIAKRNAFSMGDDILPKLFEWDETLWAAYHTWRKQYDVREKLRNAPFFSRIPWLKGSLVFLADKLYRVDYTFHEWSYFRNTLLPVVTKALLGDEHGSHLLFTELKKFALASDAELEKQTDEKVKQRRWDHTKSVFDGFSPTFFENVRNAASSYNIWDYSFPPEWKLVSSNIENRVSRIFREQFLKWAHPRIVSGISDSFDQELTEVASGLCPGVHSDLFPLFLVAFICRDVETVIATKFRFYVMTLAFSHSGEQSAAEIRTMFDEASATQERETVDLILAYFGKWYPLLLFNDDMTSDEAREWDSYSEAEKKAIQKRGRLKKLRDLNDELNSEKIIKLCANNDHNSANRKAYLRLVELLIERFS